MKRIFTFALIHHRTFVEFGSLSAAFPFFVERGSAALNYPKGGLMEQLYLPLIVMGTVLQQSLLVSFVAGA